MICGIEDTTDMRYPETRIQRFSRESAAIEWARDGGGFAWNGAADSSLPSQQQNWHHRLREIYRMPSGWRPPSKRETEKILGPLHLRTSTYRRGHLEVVASRIRKHGTDIPVPRNAPALKEQAST